MLQTNLAQLQSTLQPRQCTRGIFSGKSSVSCLSLDIPLQSTRPPQFARPLVHLCTLIGRSYDGSHTKMLDLCWAWGIDHRKLIAPDIPHPSVRHLLCLAICMHRRRRIHPQRWQHGGAWTKTWLEAIPMRQNRTKGTIHHKV